MLNFELLGIIGVRLGVKPPQLGEPLLITSIRERSAKAIPGLPQTSQTVTGSRSIQCQSAPP